MLIHNNEKLNPSYGTLYLVATPIGNLEDITLRALRILKEVDVIACEDTRVSTKLLMHYDITGKKLIPYHDKNEINSSKGIIMLLEQGKNVAVISDAGMPIINDPGFRILQLAKNSNIHYEMIPGVSALSTTLSLSSLDTHCTFLGFLKDKTISRQNQLKKLIPGSYIIFASPHKLLAILKDIQTSLGDNTKVFVAKELTKKFEQHIEGNISEILEYFLTIEVIKGEYSIAFEFE